MIYVIVFSILVCLYLSSFFSGSEIAFSSVNLVRLENMSEKGNTKAKRAFYITKHFDDALSTILIGNNLVNIAASSLGTVLVFLISGSDKFTWVSTVVITVLVIVFGETIPKIVCRKNSLSKSLSYSGFLRFLMVLLKPVVFIVVSLVNVISKLFKEKPEEKDNEEESVEELQSIVETAQIEGVLDKDESEMIHNAIDFADIMASEVMTARVDVNAIDIDDSWETKVKTIINSKNSRLPVYKDSIDNIIGVLHLNIFFLEAARTGGKEFDLTKILMKPCYVYKTMKLPHVLKVFQTNKQHLAIVTDEYSGTLGVVTLEDVLEQIVGEIWDEKDEVENDVVQKNDSEMELDGDLPVSEFLELTGIDEDDFEFESETVGGWVIEILERFPVKGDSFTFRNLKITVLEVDERRVDKIKVVKTQNKDDAE